MIAKRFLKVINSVEWLTVHKPNHLRMVSQQPQITMIPRVLGAASQTSKPPCQMLACCLPKLRWTLQIIVRAGSPNFTNKNSQAAWEEFQLAEVLEDLIKKEENRVRPAPRKSFLPEKDLMKGTNGAFASPEFFFLSHVSFWIPF